MWGRGRNTRECCCYIVILPLPSVMLSGYSCSQENMHIVHYSCPLLLWLYFLPTIVTVESRVSIPPCIITTCNVGKRVTPIWSHPGSDITMTSGPGQGLCETSNGCDLSMKFGFKVGLCKLMGGQKQGG